MADNKYGRLFTQEDVEKIVELMDPSGFDAGSARVAIEELGSEAKFPVDEPLFVLRAQDRYAGPAIGHYLEMCKVADLSEPHVNAVNAAWQDFQEFFDSNPDKVKDPD